MSQAPKTLPDPLEVAAAESGPNADEILSQLAGEEIDRLLAEAESPRSDPVPQVAVAKSTTPAPPAAPAASGKSAEQDLNQQLDALFNQLNDEAPEAPAPPAASGTPAGQDLDQQLDVPFNQLSEETLAPSEPVVVPTPVTLPTAVPPKPTLAQSAPIEQPQVPAVGKLQAAPAVATPAQVTTSLENDVLAATELARIPEAAAAKEPAPRPKQKTESGESRVSLFLRPVAWLSSLFPETALDWMGKVAILTTINAMVIFAYILIRRH